MVYHAALRLLYAYPEVYVLEQPDVDDVEALSDRLMDSMLYLRVGKTPGDLRRHVRQVIVRHGWGDAIARIRLQQQDSKRFVMGQAV